ncbi:hypothetical protein B0H10DRAFT_480875 [Mycena sp. CBHHK59/15]|nr:hypothetical protein B0H10DRAFT_480875 [Mycena sp. CBHHK59/15]
MMNSSLASSGPNKTVAAVGGAVGALIILIGGVLLCLFLRGRRRRQVLFLSSRPESPLSDVERSLPSEANPVFSMVTPHASTIAPTSSMAPSSIAASPDMGEVSPRHARRLTVHKKPVPAFTAEDLASSDAGQAATKPAVYTLEVSPPSSMMFDPATFGQSLGKDPAWAAALEAPAAATNPFMDPVDPFADPQAPKTRLSEMPEIPKHLRMSTTSSTLSTGSRDPEVRTIDLSHVVLRH